MTMWGSSLTKSHRRRIQTKMKRVMGRSLRISWLSSSIPMRDLPCRPSLYPNWMTVSITLRPDLGHSTRRWSLHSNISTSPTPTATATRHYSSISEIAWRWSKMIASGAPLSTNLSSKLRVPNLNIWVLRNVWKWTTAIIRMQRIT